MNLDKLIQEYKNGRKGLYRMLDILDESDRDQVDRELIQSMIRDMTYVIKWLETGRNPDSQRGVDKNNAYRVTLYDDMDIIPDINSELTKEREPLYMSPKQRTILINLIKRLSERERQCFIMHHAEQMSMQEIADELGVSKSAVQCYLSRARDKIKRTLS